MFHQVFYYFTQFLWKSLILTGMLTGFKIQKARKNKHHRIPLLLMSPRSSCSLWVCYLPAFSQICSLHFLSAQLTISGNCISQDPLPGAFWLASVGSKGERLLLMLMLWVEFPEITATSWLHFLLDISTLFQLSLDTLPGFYYCCCWFNIIRLADILVCFLLL